MTETAVTEAVVTEAVVGLGANIGDAVATLRDAVTGLDQAPGVRVVAVAGLWRSAPVGGPEQPDFHNTVALVCTEGSAEDLLALAQALEGTAGRVRSVRWGPRTLDVDVIAFDDLRSVDPALTLPHPRAHQRAFVLRPWAQLQPDRVLEAAGAARNLRQWEQLVADQEVALVAEGPWWQRQVQT